MQGQAARAAALGFVLVLLFTIARADDDDEDASNPAVQEERYRDVIKCGSCEHIVERLVERAERDPMGSVVPLGTNRRKTLSNREKATRTARALDIVEGGCDTESGRERIYCQDALGRFEDEFVELVIHDGVHPRFAEAKDICGPACEYKTAMKTQVDDMKEQIRAMSQKPLLDEVLGIFAEFWYVWIGMFAVTLALSIWIQLRLRNRYARHAASERAKAK